MLRNLILIAIPVVVAALTVPNSSQCSKGCNCNENVAVCDTLNLEHFGLHIFHLKIINPKVPLILKGQPFNVRGLENVNSISIENATILEIDKSAFVGTPLLSSFNILNSNVSEIDNKHAFTNAVNLKNLRITNSTLKKFEGIVSHSLEELDLSGCQLTEISENSFDNILNLSYLNLADNKLSKIHPLAFVKLSRLEEVILSGNNISALDPNLFKNNTEISILNLSKNPLKTFDVNFTSDLEYLILKSCELEQFGENLSDNLKLLSHLDLSDNRINLSNAAFDKMEELEFIDLSNNGLKNLDPHIFRSNSRLQKIILDGNDLAKLPKFVCKNGNFGTYFFSCKNCNLFTLSVDTFKHFPAVVVLDLSNNYLNSADLKAMQYLPSLIDLKLAHNQLSIIYQTSFLKSTGLEKLNLAGNPLVSLESSIFNNNRAIKALDVSFSGLRQLWKQPVKRNVTSLRLLNIANNSFSTLSLVDLKVTPSLEVLDISNNPLRCDENLRDAITWLTERSVSPASAPPTWKTHESMNQPDVAELEPMNDGVPSWKFLAKQRCSEEDYTNNFEEKEEELEMLPTTPKPDSNNVVPSIKERTDNNVSDDDDDYDDDYDYSYEDTSKSDNVKVNSNTGDSDGQFIEDEGGIDISELTFESTKYRTQYLNPNHSRYSFLWPTLVFVFTALSVLVIAANIMLLMLRSRMIPRHMNLPHIKIPQWSTSSKLKKHSGSVYQPLSEDRPGPCTPIITRKDYVPTHSPKSVV